MYYSFAFVKFLKTDPPQVKVGDDWLCVILDDVLTVEKIEDLRRLDSLKFEQHKEHFLANFLPDSERPADVPGYEETLKRAKKS